MAKLLSTCPTCGNTLKVSSLQCPDCGLELKNSFELSPFDCLSPEQHDFLIAFLKCHGNLSALQAELHISYACAKKKFSELLMALGITESEREKTEVTDMENWNFSPASSKASEIIRLKLKECGGCVTVYSLNGKPYEIKIVDSEHFICPQLISYSFSVFDVIVDLLTAQNGKAKKGNARAAPLGGQGCEEWTVAGAILKNYFGKRVGESGLDPVHVFAAVLDWAGIANNERGYLELTPAYKNRLGEECQ